jgi:iron complex outermembrane recepter protein
MNPKPRTSAAALGNAVPFFLRVFAAVFSVFVFIAVPRLHAQSTGTIEGRVFNPATGQYVRDAEVRLQGTERIVNTGSDGSFRFEGVAPGQATVTVNYTGYVTATEPLNVSAGQIATREINLTSAAAGARAGETVKLDVFTVSSEREGNAKAIMAQRRNMNITTSVASDIFGDVSEGNVGEFLKFLPGVDLEYVDAETRGPRLGGLDPQYVGVTTDGARLASADAFASYNGFINGAGGEGSRSVGFEQMSINSIESIEVSRTSSADMDEDSPAGTINLKTKKGFDRKGRRVDWQFSLTANSDDFKWGKTHRPGDKEERLIRPSWKLDYSDVFLNQRLGLAMGLSQSKTLVQQNSVQQTFSKAPTAIDPRQIVITQLGFGDGPKFLDRDAASLTADFKASPRLILSFGAMYSTYNGITFSRSMTFTAANANANAALAPTQGRVTVLGDGLTTLRTSGATNTVRAVGISGGQNFDKGTKTFTLTPRFEYTWNRLLVDGTFNLSKSKNDYVSLPSGSTRLETTNDLAGIDFIATRPNVNSPEWTITQTSGPDWSNAALYTNPRVSTNEDRGALVTIYQADLNARYNLPFERPTFLKFGGKITQEYRKSYTRGAANAYSYVGPGGNTVAANGTIGTNGSFANFVSPRTFATRHGKATVLRIANLPPIIGRELIADAFKAHPEWFVSTTTSENYYTAFYGNFRDFMQEVPALYGMANTRLGKWQFQAGLRWAETETTTKEFDPRTGAEMLRAGYTLNANRRATTIQGIDYQFGSKPRVKRTGEYDNFFPSFSAKYAINRNMQAQFGYSHAISRPPINALSGVWVVDDVNLVVNAPNQSLKPEISDNYVARLAYYFEPVGSFTFLLQQNEIKDIRQSVRYTADEFGFADDPAYAGYEFVTSENGERLFRFRNMEIGYNQQLSFLPGALRNTNFSLNYSRSYANQRRPGTLPHKFSGGISWNYQRVNVRLNGIWQDDAQWTTTLGRYQKHNLKVDLSGGFRLTARTSLFVQGRNIFNTPREVYDENIFGLPPMLQGYFNYGVSWAFGIKGNF